MTIIPKFAKGSQFNFSNFFNIWQKEADQFAADVYANAQMRKATSPSESDDDIKGKITEKDLAQAFDKLNALPNETEALVKGAMSVLSMTRSASMSNLNNLATYYISHLGKIKIANYNKELFNKTYDRAVSRDSLNDIAITTDGKVVVMDEDSNISYKSPEEWVRLKDSGKYEALTNSHLLWLRSNSSKYKNKNTIFQIVENGIGLNEVHKILKNNFINVGKIENHNESYLPQNVAAGMKEIANMVKLGPEGYYKITNDSTTYDATQINAALEYMYDALPKNAKTRLALETQNGTQDEVKDVIKRMIFGKLDYKNTYSSQYIAMNPDGTRIGSKGSKRSGSGDDDEDGLETSNKFKDTIAMRFIQGQGYNQQFRFNLGNNRNIIVNAYTLPLAKANDHSLEVGDTLADITGSSYSGVLNMNSVSMGGNIINPLSLNQVIVKDGKITSLDYPIDVNVKNTRGEIVPDLSIETQQKKDKAEKILQQNGINVNDPAQVAKNYQTINQIYESVGLPPAYDSTGNPLKDTWARFGVVEVATDGRVLGKDMSDQWIKRITDDTVADNIINYIQARDKNYKSTRKDWFGADHLYEGLAWIPVTVSYSASMGTQRLTLEDNDTLYKADYARENINSLNLGAQSVIN